MISHRVGVSLCISRYLHTDSYECVRLDPNLEERNWQEFSTWHSNIFVVDGTTGKFIYKFIC